MTFANLALSAAPHRSWWHPAAWYAHLQAPTSILPLIVLRIAFGLLMFVGTIRFMANGWIAEFYLQPAFHFTYYGFGWIKPLPGIWLYGVYGVLALAALGIALGAFYRVSTVLFWLLFTYTELLDKTYYLNHYYFISLLGLLLILLPLQQWAAVDSWRRPAIAAATVPHWCLWVVRLQLGLVYCFAGVAKLKADWLLDAMPLRIWLAANSDFPLIGSLFATVWLPYLMSWSGALYDLSIPFFLLQRRTRPWAYLAVIGFHVMTGLLFPIGLFPAIMIGCTLVFFTAEDWARLGWRLPPPPAPLNVGAPLTAQPWWGKVRTGGLCLFFLLQLLVPLRHWLYPGNVLWTEEGYRFAWNVMLAEKTGHVTFTVVEPASGREMTVFPSDYLTYQQEKQMSFQPDMILEFAHYLAQQCQAQGLHDVAVYAEAYVSLNGRPSRLLIDPTVDLVKETNSLLPKPWILP